MSYNPYLTNPYTGQQYYSVPQIQQPVPTQNQQIQNNGLISVRNIDEARNYPIAPGNSITFKDENSPYVYTKTMGFSQLDRPIFEKYRLVKEEAEEVKETPAVNNSPAYVLQADYETLRGIVDGLKEELETVKGQISKRRTKKEEEE